MGRLDRGGREEVMGKQRTGEREVGRDRWERRKVLEDGRETWPGDEHGLLFLQSAAALRCAAPSPGSSASTVQGGNGFLTLHPGLPWTLLILPFPASPRSQSLNKAPIRSLGLCSHSKFLTM